MFDERYLNHEAHCQLQKTSWPVDNQSLSADDESSHDSNLTACDYWSRDNLTSCLIVPYLSVRSTLGVAAIVLACAQPLNAMIRPAPSPPDAPFFTLRRSVAGDRWGWNRWSLISTVHGKYGWTFDLRPTPAGSSCCKGGSHHSAAGVNEWLNLFLPPKAS